MTHRYYNDFVDDPARQCHGKYGYCSKQRAKRILRRLKKQGSLHVYRCPHCRLWHLGGKQPR